MPKVQDFSSFTHKYSLSKTLRFELRPVGKTQAMLDDDQVFTKDQQIQEKYQKTKPYFDRLHREFVTEALAQVTLTGLEDYLVTYKNFQKNKKDKVAQKTLEKQTSQLRGQILVLLNKNVMKWKKDLYTNSGLKKNDIEILFEEGVFRILKERYGHETETLIEDKTTGENISIFDSWKGFTGYFDKFFYTRKNLYTADGKATALATRMIDQNLQRFCDNMQCSLRNPPFHGRCSWIWKTAL